MFASPPRHALVFLLTACWFPTACERSPAPLAPAASEPYPTVGATSASASSAEAAKPTAAAAAPARPECPRQPLHDSQEGTFYVCDCQKGASGECRPGSDDDAGTHGKQAWRTLQRARRAFEELPAGGTLALCRGGSFEASEKSWVNAQCRADKPCVIRDYTPAWAEAQAPKPLLRSQGHGLSFANGGNARHEEGYLVANLEMRGKGEGTGVMVYNDIDHVTLCGLSIENFSLGVHVSGSNPPEAGSDGLNSYISLLESRIIGNRDQGWLGSCAHCSIEKSYFENNGYARAVLNHNIYLDGEGSSIRIVGNELYRSAMVDGKCRGVSLVVHGVQKHVLIEDNTIREDLGKAAEDCWGIAVDGGYPTRAESFTDVSIKNNRVSNVGSIAIGVGSCQRCTLQGNTIIQHQAFESRAIAAPNRERGADDAALEQITIAGNSIEFGPNGLGHGILLGDEGQGHRLSDNTVRYAGRRPFQCFEIHASARALSSNVNNSCQIQ